MNPLDTEFHRRLIKRLNDESMSEDNALRSGNLDHPDYKRICGRLRAFTDVAAWCAEIESAMNQGT